MPSGLQDPRNLLTQFGNRPAAAGQILDILNHLWMRKEVLYSEHSMKNIQLFCFIIFLNALFVTSSWAAEIAKKISFERGTSSAVVEGSVVRGDRDVYTVKARAGQLVTINVSAIENNAAFSLFEAGELQPVAGTQDEDDAINWNGTLRRDGAFRIVVGGTRGNANYKLRLSIK